MKSPFLSLLAVAMITQLTNSQAQSTTDQSSDYRKWTKKENGGVIEAMIVEKKADDTEVTLRMHNGKDYPVKTDLLSPGDREFVKKWVKPEGAQGGSANGQTAGGIVVGRASILSQAQGGKSGVMDDLEFLLSKYGAPENDLAAHPDVTIYEGPPMDPKLGPVCRITYLMPRVKAEELLLGNARIKMKKSAVAPGFPPGMNIYTYDIKISIFNRLYLMVDVADQVVTMQVKSESIYAPEPTWTHIVRDFSTFDYIGTETRAKPMTIDTDVRKVTHGIEVNMAVQRIGETTRWFVPEPLIKQILFNLQESRKSKR